MRHGVLAAGLVVAGAASVKNGSARILSTTKLITCTAFLVDDLSDPPTSMVSLPVIVKKQEGN